LSLYLECLLVLLEEGLVPCLERRPEEFEPRMRNAVVGHQRQREGETMVGMQSQTRCLWCARFCRRIEALTTAAATAQSAATEAEARMLARARVAEQQAAAAADSERSAKGRAAAAEAGMAAAREAAAVATAAATEAAGRAEAERRRYGRR
jgi:hypothetical protein